MTLAELRRRVAVLEEKAPAEPASDPELAAKFEAMTNEELDAELERRMAEYAASPEGKLFAARLEALSDQELEAFMKWHCTDPKLRGLWTWPTS